MSARPMLRCPVMVAVEGRPGRREGRGHRRTLAGPADGLGDQLGGRREQPERVERAGPHAHQAAAEQLSGARVAAVLPLLAECERLRVGLERAQVRDQVGAGHPVDGRVVHLREADDLVVVVPLDDPHLPQRPGPVQRQRGEVRGQGGELAVAAGLREGQPVHVALDVELLVPDPDRVVEAERHPTQLAGERRDVLDPSVDLRLHQLEGVRRRHGARVEHDQAAHVHQLGGRLEVEEAGVQAGESVHGVIVGRSAGTCSTAPP